MTILGDEIWPVVPREAHKRAFNFLFPYTFERDVCVSFLGRDSPVIENIGLNLFR